MTDTKSGRRPARRATVCRADLRASVVAGGKYSKLSVRPAERRCGIPEMESTVWIPGDGNDPCRGLFTHPSHPSRWAANHLSDLP